MASTISRSERELLDLVGGIYDAALNPDLWPELLGRVTAALDASGLGFYVADGHDGTVGFFEAVGIPEPDLAAYRDYYGERNVWFREAFRRRLPACEAELSQDWFPEDRLVASEFYNDYLRPLDIHHHCGGPLRYDGPNMSVFNVLRPRGAGPFETRHRAFCQVLMPHFARAVQLHRGFHEVRSARDAALETLDRMVLGVLLVDGGGRVAFMNRSARDLVATRDGLTLGADGSCLAARSGETAALRRLVAGAARTGREGGLASGGALALPRPSGRRPFAVLVAPLRRTPFNLGSGDPAAVVFVADPDRRHEPPAEILAGLYHLTPMEARVVAALAEGGTLARVADSLGITRNTAHTHLKAAYRKTGTSRRSELVALLLAGPAGAQRPTET